MPPATYSPASPLDRPEPYPGEFTPPSHLRSVPERASPSVAEAEVPYTHHPDLGVEGSREQAGRLAMSAAAHKGETFVGPASEESVPARPAQPEISVTPEGRYDKVTAITEAYNAGCAIVNVREAA